MIIYILQNIGHMLLTVSTCVCSTCEHNHNVYTRILYKSLGYNWWQNLVSHQWKVHGEAVKIRFQEIKTSSTTHLILWNIMSFINNLYRIIDWNITFKAHQAVSLDFFFFFNSGSKTPSSPGKWTVTCSESSPVQYCMSTAQFQPWC